MEISDKISKDGFRIIRTPGIDPDLHELIEAKILDDGDVVALVRTKGSHYLSSIGHQAYGATEYALVRLTPIATNLDQSFGRPLASMKKVVRREIYGSYRYDQRITSVEPGRAWKRAKDELLESLRSYE